MIWKKYPILIHELKNKSSAIYSTSERTSIKTRIASILS